MRSWTEEYYDLVEHYFWAPDQIGHRSDKDRKLKKPAEVMARLRRNEEPLNHILGLFFALAPISLVHDIFRGHCNVEADAHLLTLMGRSSYSANGIGEATQPDFAFDGDGAFLTVEAKIGSKSSIEQLLKYAFLHWKADVARPRTIHALVYLTDAPLAKLYPGGFESWEDAKRRATEALPEITKQAFTRLSAAEREAVVAMLQTVRIGHMTYRDLDRIVAARLRKLTEPEGVEARLYVGLRMELGQRGLA